MADGDVIMLEPGDDLVARAAKVEAAYAVAPLDALRRTTTAIGADDDDLAAALAATAARLRACASPVARATATAIVHRLLADLQPELSQGVREQVIETALEPSAKEARPLQWRAVHEIFAPLPPTRWTVPGLQLGPGRPNLLVAYGAGLKTWAAQTLALATASGRAVWGHFECSPSLTLHFDHEQGFAATARRYQRGAAGEGLDPRDLADRLRLCVYPHLYLTGERAEDALCREVEEAPLVLIDSFKAASPGVDENSSDVRVYLDLLARVSERCGTTFLVLHHTGKPPKEGRGDARTAARGSSAIFDAAGAVLQLDKQLDTEVRLVSQTKQPASAAGPKVADFGLVIEDVEVNGEPHAGVRVRHVELTAPDPGAERDAALARDAERVLEELRKHPGSSATALRPHVGVAKSRLLEVLEVLEREGRVKPFARTGKGGGKEYRLS